MQTVSKQIHGMGRAPGGGALSCSRLADRGSDDALVAQAAVLTLPRLRVLVLKSVLSQRLKCQSQPARGTRRAARPTQPNVLHHDVRAGMCRPRSGSC